MRFERSDGPPLEIEVDEVVIAGWAGRDTGAVAHHIAELEAIGVAPPSQTPLFYRVGASLLTSAPRVQVVGDRSSGEVEAVLIATAGGLFVGLGSDHTDREAEAMSVVLSKQLCPKPMAPALWRYDDVSSHWDHLILRSWAVIEGERQPYQEGRLAGLLLAETLMEKAGGLAAGTALFCGTLPVKGGIRPAERFEMELHDPVIGRRIAHGYEIEALPMVS